MSFRITGLSPEPFICLFGLSEQALAARGALRYRVDETPGFPDRIEMRDAEIGETVLLVNHVSMAAPTPYRASHAIFVREGASVAYDEVESVPEVLRRRLLSLRGFDAQGLMVDADIVDGAEIESLIRRLFADGRVAYLHAHFAKRGCYAARIDRV